MNTRKVQTPLKDGKEEGPMNAAATARAQLSAWEYATQQTHDVELALNDLVEQIGEVLHTAQVGAGNIPGLTLLPGETLADRVTREALVVLFGLQHAQRRLLDARRQLADDAAVIDLAAARARRTT